MKIAFLADVAAGKSAETVMDKVDAVLFGADVISGFLKGDIIATEYGREETVTQKAPVPAEEYYGQLWWTLDDFGPINVIDSGPCEEIRAKVKEHNDAEKKRYLADYPTLSEEQRKRMAELLREWTKKGYDDVAKAIRAGSAVMESYQKYYLKKNPPYVI